ncbi:dienelactone hydrolase family protein [Ekhidna sp.]|uniref:dienelactone hydrolase family protein n=1 Tax=Ekhidna sp. TaxID=2608089 RepID=UPI0032989388
MKFKLIYGLMLGAFLFACTSSEKESESSEEMEEVVEVPEGEVTYSADTTSLKGYFAVGEGDSKKPGVLVIHEWWGHNEHSRERADMLAELGYVAFALDMYGDGKNTNHPDDAGKFMTAVVSDMDIAKARFESALEQLKMHPNVDPEQIAVVGYCFGGTMALSMANAGYDLDAVAAFHAGLGLPIMPDSAGVVKAKILVANGADDPMISEQQVVDFKMVMDASEVDYKYVAYEGVVHAFTNKRADEIASQHEMLSGALAYNAKADSASWEEMKILLSEVFSK